MSAFVLFASLGWHGGAYMIYYNHLLLPPLLVAAFSRLPATAFESKAAPLLVIANMLLLVNLAPPLPAPSDGPFKLAQGRALVEPILHPLAETNPSAEVIDNSQAEYLVREAHRTGHTEILRYVSAWELDIKRKIESKEFDYILLSTRGTFRRPMLIEDDAAPHLLNNYALAGMLKVYPYYLTFRNRHKFGQVPTTMLLLRPRHATTSTHEATH